jgi:hypothetical protein
MKKDKENRYLIGDDVFITPVNLCLSYESNLCCVVRTCSYDLHNILYMYPIPASPFPQPKRKVTKEERL